MDSGLSLRKLEPDKLRQLIETRPYAIQLLQTQILYDIAGMQEEILSRLEATGAVGIKFSPTRIHQWRNIPAGGSGVVYEYKVEPLVAFIHYVGCNWFPNTYYRWEIDGGDLKETVQRIIGNSAAPISEPTRLEKPVVARRGIRWVAYNNDIVPHVFEVLNDGVLYPPRIAKYLGGQSYKGYSENRLP